MRLFFCRSLLYAFFYSDTCGTNKTIANAATVVCLVFGIGYGDIMKKTKIICTLGPSSCDIETVSAMADAGMNVARLNFSHGTHEEHAARIAIVKQVREAKKMPIAILLDTKGPEFRIGTFADGKIKLKKGDRFSFTPEEIEGTRSRVSVTYKKITSVMKKGDKILLNNGLMIFTVDNVTEKDVECIIEVGGELSGRKSMFFPDKQLELDFLSENDKKDLLFGIEQGVDYIALSFVSNANDVIDVKNFLKANGGEKIEVIAKIESRTGVNNLSAIMKEADGIMVARGDLGVEIPFEELPDVQKNMINECRIYGKRVITATEMLESMIHNPRPTRAEISDVANAVYDGTSAVMLSGETAAGEYPVRAVETMAKIVERAENHEEYIQLIDNFAIKTPGEALSHAASLLAKDLNAKAIVVCTRTGLTARMVSRFRPNIPIIGLTTDERAYQKLALSWGVFPFKAEEYGSVDVLFYFAKIAAQKSGFLKRGDKIVITGGTPNGKSGNTNLICVETL